MRIVMTFIAVTLLFIVMAFPASADIIRVPDDEETIEDGIREADAGDTVMVADGVYNPTGREIRVSRRIVLMSENGPEDCIIDAQAEDSCFTITAAGVEINGFTVTGSVGPTVKASNVNDFLVKRCIFRANEQFNQIRNGVMLENCDGGRFEECTFEENVCGDSGGAMYFNNSSPTIWSCLFLNNNCDRFGGAILATGGSNPTIGNCIFRGNAAFADGGGVALSRNSQAGVYNCNFIDNEATGEGGGFYKGSDSNPEIRDCIFIGNTAEGGGNHLMQDENGGEIDIANCIIDGGVEEDGLYEGEDILDEDPGFVRGPEPLWGPDDYYLAEDSPAIDAGSVNAEEAAMDEMTTQVDRSPDEDQVDIGYHTDLDLFLIVGDLFGLVTDVADGDEIDGAVVTTSLGQEGVSNRRGFWSIPEALTGEFDITCTAEGYNDSTLTDQVLEEGEELEINFGLLHPEFILDNEEIQQDVYIDSSETVEFSLENLGNGPLTWSARTTLVGEANREPWEMRRRYGVGQTVEDDRVNGVVLIDTLLYVSAGGHDEMMIYIFDSHSEELIDSIAQWDQESRYGIRDMTFDGELIWGCAEGFLYGFTPEGELVHQFETPFRPVTNLTYDPDRQWLWIASTTTDIQAMDMDGNEMEDVELEREDYRFYGLAYWPDDQDGYPLYIVKTERDVEGYSIVKIDPESDDRIPVSNLQLWEDEDPNGAFVTGDFDFFSVTFLTIGSNSRNNGGDHVIVFQLDSYTAWMQLDTREGTLQAEELQDFQLDLNGEGFPLGSYQGQIEFTHNALPGFTDVPIEMLIVERPEPPDTDTVHVYMPDELPYEFGVQGVHPNPFNSSTEIRYSLDRAGVVTLTIYDLAGREVESAYRESREAGHHTIAVDGSEWSTGIYLARLEHLGRIKMAKMTFLK